jgi:ABC-type transporter Mla subunit MlaD
MPATKTKSTVPTRATESATAKTEADARVIDHVSHALDSAQDDLASIGGTLGAGARDLRKNVQRMLRDSQRDLKKMSKALQRDLEQLQKDLTKPAKNGQEQAAAATTGRARPKPRAGSR